jgi:hypothetical protein
MNEVALPALEGMNPLGFLAALGVLDALAPNMDGVALRWTDELVPHAIISGMDDLDRILDVLDSDREEWIGSVLLGFPAESPLTDAKPDKPVLRKWFEAVFRESGRRADSDQLSALVAEDALDGKGNAKPTHLHFTAGQQQFLEMVRSLASKVDRERLRESICGPWKYDSPLPSLSWDARGERIYAVRATNPSNEKRLGVPGADWLAFRGLIFYPVNRTINGSLRTTACDPEWKRSAFRWPLWSAPCSRNVVRSLVADRTLVSQRANVRPEDLGARGILSVLQAPIRRTDQGGYGSFGAPEVLASGFLDEANRDAEVALCAGFRCGMRRAVAVEDAEVHEQDVGPPGGGPGQVGLEAVQREQRQRGGVCLMALAGEQVPEVIQALQVRGAGRPDGRLRLAEQRDLRPGHTRTLAGVKGQDVDLMPGAAPGSVTSADPTLPMRRPASARAKVRVHSRAMSSKCGPRILEWKVGREYCHACPAFMFSIRPR